MNKDIHRDLGTRERVVSLEAAVERVRDIYPTAVAEGSMGAERSFWVNGELVCHTWPVRGQQDAMWLRIAVKQQ